MTIGKKQIEDLANLARLEFSEKEKEQLQQSLNEIVAYMEKLKKLDLENVEPMARVDESPRPFRKDQVREGLSREQVFKNAPAVKMNHFSVPKTVK
jgi:aspartyl-tRNA(Asn)/glutamyl-tRNA(Gln) amidotransferase subunit C